MSRNVFVIGLNEFNRALLGTIRNAERYRFHGVLESEALEEPPEYRVKEQLEEARQRLRAFDGPIDAIVGYIDMPVGFMVPILCKDWGLPSPSLESVLRCQHKYWSRLEQQKVIADHVPRFCLFNPFDADPLSDIDLEFPFWIKPVKSAGSYLGFRITSRKEFGEKLEVIRAGIGKISEPFQDILDIADLPSEIRDVDFSHCIAEQITPGRQCTLEGYTFENEVHAYGVVDSIRHGNRTSFARYQYPSRLPKEVQQRMVDISARVVSHLGLSDSPFNIEYFWNERTDEIWLLEINTRISQSHSYVFWKVDGASNHQVMVQLGLGERPEFPHREGQFRYAAKCFLRHFDDAVVEAVPGADRIRQVQGQIPGTWVRVNVEEGMRLAHLREQDSYSYDVAWILVAGDSPRELTERYRRCVDALGFRFSPDPGAEAGLQEGQSVRAVSK